MVAVKVHPYVGVCLGKQAFVDIRIGGAIRWVHYFLDACRRLEQFQYQPNTNCQQCMHMQFGRFTEA